MTETKTAKELRNSSWLLLIILALVWGSSFILMKRGLEAFSASQVAALRIFIAFLCLFPFVIKEIRKVKRKTWKFLILAGLLGNAIPAFLFTTAETGITSSVAGVLNALTPLFTLIVALIFYKNRIGILSFIGILLGFGGAAMLMLISSEEAHSSHPNYAMLVVLATICYAFSVNIIRNHLYHMDSLHNAGLALLTVGPLCGIYLFSTDFLAKMTLYENAWISLAYVGILAILGTAISLVLFNKLIKQSGAVFASSTTYLIPMVAVLWGLFDNEKINLFQIAGLFTILTGVYLVNKKK